MVSAEPRVVGLVLGLERQALRDRCVPRGGFDLSIDVRCASREHLPRLDERLGPVDVSFLAVAGGRSSATHGTDRRQVLADRWLGADCVRWLTQYGAANQVQRGCLVR